MASASRVVWGILRWAVIGIAAVCLVVVVILGTLRTGPGRQYAAGAIAGTIGRSVNSNVEVEGVQGRLPYDMRVSRMTFADAAGVWMTLENVYLDWSPATLLQGRIDVKEISAESVRLDRLPQREGPSRLPTLPKDVPRLTVRRFQVGRLALGEDLSPALVVLTASGRIEYVAATDGLLANVHLNQKEGPPVEGHAALAIHTKPSSTLDVSVVYDERGQGPVGHWLGVESGPVAVRLNGTGPLEGWNGEVSARAGDREVVRSRIRLEKVEPDGAERLAVVVDGRMSVPERLLPRDLQPLLGADSDFTVVAQLVPEQRLNVENAAISSLLGNLKTSGNIDFNTGAIDISFSTQLEDLAAVQPLIGVPLQGALVANGTATGRIKQPVVNVTVQATNLKLGEAGAGTLNGQLRFEALEEWEGNIGRGQFSGEGTLTNFTYAQAPLLPARDFDWRLQGATGADRVIEVRQFVLQNPAVTLTITGTYDVNTKQATFNVQFSSEDIQPISSALGLHAGGSAEVSAKGTADVSARKAAADITAVFSGLKGLPEAAAALVGETLKLDGKLEAAGGAPVFFRNVTATAAHAGLRGDVSFDPGTRQLGATAKAEVADLSVLSGVLKQPLTGSVDLDVKATGTIHDLDATLEARGQGITVGGAPVELQEARAELRDLPGAPQGRVNLSGIWRDEEVLAKAKVDSDKGQLRLSDIEVAALGTSIRGALTVNMQTRRVDGQLSGVVEDLGMVGSIVDAEVSGSGEFDVVLKSDEGRQDVALQLSARSVSTPWVSFDQLQVNADMADVYGGLIGRAAVDAANVYGEGFAFETFSGKYEGGADGGTFALHTRGTLKEPVELTARAEWRSEEGSDSFILTGLDGRWGSHPIELMSPTMLRAGRSGCELQAGVRLGPGELRAEGRWDEQIRATLAVDGLPLDIMAVAGGPGLSGAVAGQLQLSGLLSRPLINVDTRLTALGALPPLEQAPPVDVALQAMYEPNRVTGTLSVSRLFDSPVEGQFSFPLALSIRPPALDVPQQDPLDVTVRFEGRLERLAALTVMENQQISGDFRGGFEITGTPAAPVAEGETVIDGGRYENFETGTILQDLRAQVFAEGSVLNIRTATATDGRGGTIEATGTLAMQAGRGFPIDVEARLENFRIVRREDIAASATGRLDITGGLRAMNVAGILEIAPSEVSLTQWRASPIEALAVTDVNVPPALEETVAAVQPAAEVTERPPLFEHIVLELTLNVPGQAKAVGYGVESEWKGALQIAGTAAAPVFTGELTAVRGQLTFAARTFQLEEGTISFRGLSPPDPVVNIAANYRARDLTAVFRVAGPVSDPQVTLESEPQLPQDEVLAQILFGRGVSQVSPVQALQLARAANSLATGKEYPGLVGRLGHTLGLPGLALQDVGEEGGIGLGFGRYLGQNVFFNFSQAFGGESPEATLEVELSRRLTLESTVSPTGESGVSLNWKLDY